jgi:hypothetical protein
MLNRHLPLPRSRSLGIHVSLDIQPSVHGSKSWEDNTKDFAGGLQKRFSSFIPQLFSAAFVAFTVSEVVGTSSLLTLQLTLVVEIVCRPALVFAFVSTLDGCIVLDTKFYEVVAPSSQPAQRGTV